MTNIKHIEHPEDTILTGDLDILGWFQSPGRLSVKIDGAPAIVWGLCPTTGKQFVGTKSVFNKKDPKICYTEEDCEHYYHKIPVLVHILQFCLNYLPDTKYIYQGDWIGFGGERQYTPNTLTYVFPEHTGEDIIIAPHTRYELCGDNGLQDVYGLPINQNELKTTSVCRFVQPRCRMYTGYYNQLDMKDNRFELGNRVEFARQIAASVEFVNKKTANKLKKMFNKCIREGLEIEPELFAEVCDINLIRLWLLVKFMKEECLYQCRHDHSLEVYFQGDEAEHEGYVFDNGFGTYKLINREVFSHINFNHSRMARG